jgi:hypothetical protein
MMFALLTCITHVVIGIFDKQKGMATEDLVNSGSGRMTKSGVPYGARWFCNAKPLFIEGQLERVKT